MLADGVSLVKTNGQRRNPNPQIVCFFADFGALTAGQFREVPQWPPLVSDGKKIEARIADLQDHVSAKRAPLKLFLSYARGDEEKHIRELRKRLRVLERNGDILPWSDHGVTAGEKWEQRILLELEEADAVVCQVTADFLASDFCVLIELQRAIQKAEKGESRLIAYHLKTCGWKRVPQLSSFQMLPRGMKPLVEWKDRGAYWESVIDGIEAALKALLQDPRFLRKRSSPKHV